MSTSTDTNRKWQESIEVVEEEIIVCQQIFQVFPGYLQSWKKIKCLINKLTDDNSSMFLKNAV